MMEKEECHKMRILVDADAYLVMHIVKKNADYKILGEIDAQ